MVKGAKDLKLRNATERLANYLLRVNTREGDGTGFEMRQEKRRLASYLGMTPENLSRAFGALKRHGVTVRGARIDVAEPERLAAFAKPTPLIDNR
jgi:CRP/FNR family transcriptional activator FtrB